MPGQSTEQPTLFEVSELLSTEGGAKAPSPTHEVPTASNLSEGVHEDRESLVGSQQSYAWLSGVRQQTFFEGFT